MVGVLPGLEMPMACMSVNIRAQIISAFSRVISRRGIVADMVLSWIAVIVLYDQSNQVVEWHPATCMNFSRSTTGKPR